MALYKHVTGRSRHDSRTPHLLRVFGSSSVLLTPAEIAIKMGRRSDTQPATKDTARAYLRNVSRTESNLLKTGKISRRVLLKDDSRLTEEGASRYGLSPKDRDELQSHLLHRR